MTIQESRKEAYIILNRTIDLLNNFNEVIFFGKEERPEIIPNENEPSLLIINEIHELTIDRINNQLIPDLKVKTNYLTSIREKTIELEQKYTEITKES